LQHTVEDGVTGFLVPAGAPDALANNLRLILFDRNLREQLATSARHKAQGYTWQLVAERILHLYEELCQRS
jgi:glycosyltransferase involved in cell wall biosynthesis